MRHTRAQTRNRRSHHALKGERLSSVKESGVKHPRHHALLDGTPYRGRSVMDRDAKIAKKATTLKKTTKATKKKGSHTEEKK